MTHFFYEQLWHAVEEGELWERHQNGSIIPVWCSISGLFDDDGDIERYIVTLYDLTEQKKSQDKINYLAHYDVLTGLPNRAMFKARLSHAVKFAERHNIILAALIIDLDKFKQVNYSYGLPVGDELLCEFSKRLQDALRKSDTLSRIGGGDEFMVLLENMETVHSIKTAAQKIIGVLAQPVVTSERRQCIGAEALVRWKHKTKGFVPPEKFVPIAGESDLIHTTRGVGIVYGMCSDESVD